MGGSSKMQGPPPRSIPAVQDAGTNFLNMQDAMQMKSVGDAIGGVMSGLGGIGSSIGRGQSAPAVRTPIMVAPQIQNQNQADPLQQMYQLWLAEQNANKV